MGEHNDLKVDVRLSREEIRELDAWISAQRVPGLGRGRSMKSVVDTNIAVSPATA